MLAGLEPRRRSALAFSRNEVGCIGDTIHVSTKAGIAKGQRPAIGVDQRH